MNWEESCIYDGSCFTYSCNQWSTKDDMFSVIPLQLETIGLIPCGFLWIFLRKYSLDVRCFFGGEQNLCQSSNKKPLFFMIVRLVCISCFRVSVVSSLSFWYVFTSLRCFSAFSMYYDLSSTITVFPLSALFIIRCRFFCSWFSAVLSRFVRLSDLFCLYAGSWSISSCRIFHRAVSSVLCTVSCSLKVVFFFVLNGSLVALYGFLYWCDMNVSLALVINSLTSLYRSHV